MPIDQDRSQKMTSACEARISQLETRIEKTRARLIKEREVLAKHEIALGRKEASGKEIGVSQERVDKKREQITGLEDQIEELTALCEILRQEIGRLLGFHPVKDQLNQLPKGFRRAGEKEWEIPNSRFKTFEDIFTPPEARVVPSVSGRLSRQIYDGLPLTACPVDPARIPDWFIKEFGLGSLEGMDSFEKQERKTEVIPEVRRIFEHLSPLEAYHNSTHRVLVVQGYAPEHDGKIMMTAYSGREPENRDRKIMQVYDSAYEAQRRSSYIDRQYTGEREKIRDMRGRLRQIGKELEGMKKGDPKKEEIEKRLSAEVETLGHVTNIHKVQAADILEDITDIKDKLGRVNPGRTCARMVRARNLLSNRLPQIFEKSPRVTADARILTAEINRSKEVLDGNYHALSFICDAIEDGELLEGLNKKFQGLPDLDDLTTRPFNLYAGKIQQKKAGLRAALDTGDREKMKSEALSAYIACKTFQIQHEREIILRDIAASPMEVTIESLLSRARGLSDLVTSKETLKEVRSGQNEPYRQMAKRIMDLVRGLEAYRRRKLSDDERLAMYERMKKYIEEIDFTEILEKL